MENEMETQEASIPEQEQSTSETETQQEEGSGDALAELEKAKEVARNQKIRAEKAEKELKALKDKPAEKETPKNDQVPLKDILALRDVHDEDVEEVINYAKYKGVSIADAKKDPIVQTLLRTRAEERTSAQAAATGTQKKGVAKLSDEELVNRFRTGKYVPDNSEDMNKVAEAEIRLRKAKK